MKHSKWMAGAALLIVAGVSAAYILSGRHGKGRVNSRADMVATSALGTRSNGSQPLLPPSSLTLSGDVIELQAGAPLIVSATVGSETYWATVSGNTYTVNVGRPTSDQIIFVEAWSPRVHYRSFAGSAGLLRGLAGPDTNVVLSEHPALRISPYTTSLGWLARQALGDREATSDVEFDRATRTAASGDLESAAYALAAIANEERELPEGYADGFELLRDREVFSYFAAYVDFRAAAKGYLFEQPQETAVSVSETLPEQLAFLDGAPRDQLPIYPGDVFVLSRRLDGNFDFTERTPLMDPVNTFEVDSQGRILLAPVGIQTRVVQKPDQYGQYLWYDRIAVGRTLKRLTRGSETSVWAMRSSWSDRPHLNPSAPAVEEIEYHVLSSTEIGQWAAQEGWASLTGSTATLPWICTESVEVVYELSNCGLVEHRFESNGVGQTLDHGWKISAVSMLPAPGRSESFSWMRGAQGALDLTDGKVATSFWRLEGYPVEVGPVLYRSRAQVGQWAGYSMVGVDMVAKRNMGAWPANAMVGEWQSGVADSLPNWYATVYSGQSNFIQRLANGSGQETYATNAPLPLSWQSEGNAVYDRRNRAFYDDESGPPFVPSCEAAISSAADQCEARVRYFKPVARIGGRHYGIEENYIRSFYRDLPEENSTVRTYSQFVYYDCKGGQCANISPVALLQPARTLSGIKVRPRVPARLPGGRHTR